MAFASQKKVTSCNDVVGVEHDLSFFGGTSTFKSFHIWASMVKTIIRIRGFGLEDILFNVARVSNFQC